MAELDEGWQCITEERSMSIAPALASDRIVGSPRSWPAISFAWKGATNSLNQLSDAWLSPDRTRIRGSDLIWHCRLKPCGCFPNAKA